MKISRWLQRFGFLLAVLSAAACSNRQPTFIPAPQDAGNNAVVYIYRPFSTSNFMMSPTVVIDGNQKFSIGNGDYHYLYLPEGNHDVSLNPSKQYLTAPALTMRFEAGSSYYLRVVTLLKFEPDRMNTRKFWLEEISVEQALEEITATAYGGATTQPAAGRADDASPSQGFSIDKTRDPFSGKD